MKGYWKHIAASASITAVFVVCALALSVSAVPVSVPAVEAAATLDVRCASLTGSLTRLIQAVDEAWDAAPAETPAPAQTVQTTAQPAPAAAVPAQAEPPAATPAAPQPDDSNPQQAAPPPPPQINPPANLAGVFVPNIPPYIELTWDPNNQPRYIDYFLVYRQVVGQAGEIKVVRSRKSTYDDYDITAGKTYRYWVTVVSRYGEESDPSNVIEVEPQPLTPPAPPQGVVAAALDPGVSFDWEPNGEENLAGYNVYLNLNGRWKVLNNKLLTDVHYYYPNGSLGQTYAVCAVNDFGIESGYSVVQPVPTTPVIYEENDPAVTVQGNWVIERYEGASGGSIIVAGSAGERLNFTFTGRQVKLIAANYWTCGDARIYVDGELMGTVSMYSYDPVFQSIDISLPGLKYKQHVLTIEVVGAGNPETEFDFVNVDAFEVR
ncbi:MAG: hypothetical protein JW854_14310 [Actinobacteria bacterium]|nr:hypothetical protein [Actinomycetota bacterium]